MASDQGFVDYVVDQIAADCGVTYKKMFGEYGLYSSGKMFAMICDDRLFVKPTGGGRAHIGEVVEAPPYPGAKPIFLIEDQLEDGEWLSELVRITARELPEPKPKKKRAKKKA
jgi:TfoX/Sxy family transcriptional regulator of competence genes